MTLHQSHYAANSHESQWATLTALANKFGSDKGTQVGDKHGYTLIYEMLFHALRGNPLRVLELGLQTGGPEKFGVSPNRQVSDVPSIRMWLEYFKYAEVVGFDISDFSRFETNRFKFVQGDLSIGSDLIQLARAGPFDIVVDDASHASYHQQLAFCTLFPSLTNRGFYIIEDVHWQPAHYEKAYPGPKTKFVFEYFARRRQFPKLDGCLSESLRRCSKEIGGVLLIPGKGDRTQLTKAVILQRITVECQSSPSTTES